MNDVPTDPRGARGSLIDRLVLRARLALMWEGAWPALAAALSVALLFLSLSWFGLWDALPSVGRIAGVLLFAAALAAALFPLVRIANPDRRALLGRVDRASGLTHRPATSLDDKLAPLGEDPLTRALWQAHRDRMDVDASRLRAGGPAPRLAARDPYALRFLMGLVVVVAFAVAGSDRGARVAAAFDWSTPAAETAPVRIDAWVAPPSYTGRPPLFLTGGRPAGAPQGDPRAAALPATEPEAAAEALRAPTGSTLVIRGAGGAVDIAMTGAAEPIEIKGKPPEGVTERRFKLVGDAEVKVSAAGEAARSWRFSVIPDVAPTVALKGPPTRNARGSTTVAYEVKDDYGVAGAEARFALKARPAPPRSKMSVGIGASADASPPEKRPLYEAPKVNLALPRARAREGQAQTSLDLMEHPWAGAEATMTLVARDEAGQEGASAPVDMRLPARAFTNPLARALVEQRRELALDANAKPQVGKALQALAMFPEEFTPETAIYLGLRTAYWRLDIARTDDELRGVADYLWEIALRIEDGDLPAAERELRAAEEALRKALEEGASEQEIAKLTQELRAALDKFMKELAQRAQQPNQQAQRSPNGAKTVRPQDLQKMIDRMEQAAKNGSKEAAQQALNELREMLDNLQTAQRQQQDPGQQAQQQQMDKLQEMIREQNKLRDKTYQQYRQNERAEQNQRGQQGRRQPQHGQRQQSEQGDMQALSEEQKALRDKLDQMMKDMQKGEGEQGEQGKPQPGQQQGRQSQEGQGEQGQGQQGQGQQGQGRQQSQGQGEGENALGEAGRSMGDARGALGKGESGQALDDQGKALENLRKGAQALAKQMQEGQQGGQPGGQQPGQQGQQGQREGEDGRDDDPLGRPVRRRESDGTTTKVPGEIEAQRARRVLEELRRRLGESERPRDELDYLERLLTP